MDNKKAIIFLDDLKHDELYSENVNTVEALDKAIASLEAWDKVKEEMKYFYNVYDSYDEEELTEYELWVVSLSKRHYKHALYIINKHLKEIEE